MTFKTGQTVFMAWDGKMCRSNIGIVVGTTQHRVIVSFMCMGIKTHLSARKYGSTDYQRRYKAYGGWADNAGWWRIFKMKDVPQYYIDMAKQRAKDHESKEGWDD